MDKLTFAELRAANIKRLPLFRNKLGLPAHKEQDGSDWSDAQWLQALVGEVGEYANLRKKYDRGDIGEATFLHEAANELADIQTYLDILAFRLGIDLGQATREKFNAVSLRVRCNVFLEAAPSTITTSRVHGFSVGNTISFPFPRPKWWQPIKLWRKKTNMRYVVKSVSGSNMFTIEKDREC